MLRLILHKIFNRMTEASYGQKGFFINLLEVCLTPVSWVYGGVVKIRNALYELGLLKQRRASIPVVSIGNVEAGGTGKTPLTLYLASAMSTYCKVAVILRGYGSRAEKEGKEALIVPKGERVAHYFGDEAALIAERVPEALVIVSKDRVKGAALAVAQGASLIILDDGMQHRRLYRDFEIATFSERIGSNQGKYLPAGVLRDSKKRLSKADLLVSSHKPVRESPNLVLAQSTPLGTFDLSGAKVEISGKKVALFCAIARPQRFKEAILQKGAEVVFSHFLPDHGNLSEKLISYLIAKAKEKGAEVLICTEKDKVKLPVIADAFPVAFLRMGLEIKANHAAWTGFIERLKSRVRT